ncbi:HAMP domain-containing protein [Frankia sp. Cppng1_Ct_nod]|uniref:HAMP domain-containing protein n=1 Tax=Frankia sp. Cppng1_Ct_nod TaxID=2897162 RepID=UPI002023E41F|nr:HAMP domain-containing protein [Frankia sp. Cppng1_Ct_nod]
MRRPRYCSQAWALAGAALRPVERMRRQVVEISEHDTAATLEIPATRDEIAALATTLNGLLMRLQAGLLPGNAGSSPRPARRPTA